MHIDILLNHPQLVEIHLPLELISHRLWACWYIDRGVLFLIVVVNKITLKEEQFAKFDWDRVLGGMQLRFDGSDIVDAGWVVEKGDWRAGVWVGVGWDGLNRLGV